MLPMTHKVLINYVHCMKKFLLLRVLSVNSMILKDESAVAYGIVIIALFLFSCGILLVLLSHPVNEVIDGMNTIIGMEDVSKETTDCAAFQTTVWKALPVILLFGVFAWGIVRAIESGGEQT